MREIKFRGKRVDNGEWVYGSLIRKYGKPHKVYIPFGYRIEVNADEIYEVIPETVGQYTGLKDKNGKKIYEGDIIKVIKLTFTSSGTLPENLNVKFYSGMFQLFRGNECLMGLHLTYIKDGEIIGNILDNPELLGEAG